MKVSVLVALLIPVVLAPSALAAGNPPVNKVRPAISGDARYGATLSGSRGSWAGSKPMTFAYQWQRCDAAGNNCADISGAGALAYTLVTADIGQRVHLRVTARNAYGSAEARSVTSAVVVSPPVNTVLPSLSGLARRGETLTALAGTWVGTPQITYAYRWSRCDSAGTNCAEISGATGSSYLLTSADVGGRVHARVTATNGYGSTIKQTSNSSVVVGAPENTALPAISGQAQVGQTLSATSGSWTGTQPLTYAYRWRRCNSAGDGCADIEGAVAQTYAVVAADANTTLRVSVTAANAHGATVATSAQTAVVSSPPPPPPPSGDWDEFIGLAAYTQSDLGRIASYGVRRVRWDRPSPAIINAGRSLGIDVLPIAAYNPWPDLNGGMGDHVPPTPSNHDEWARRMVDTWRGMSQPPTVVEVWNEPWLTEFWQPAPNPAAYLSLVKAFAAEAWAEWPNLTILVSADTNGSGAILWRKQLLAADTTGLLADPRIRPTTHNYVEGRSPTEVTSQPCWWDLDRFECAYDDFLAHGHPDPQVWITEYGWESSAVGTAAQADYTEQALGIFRDSGKVAASYAFFLKTNDPWSFNWLRPDNTEKPVVARVQSMLSGDS